MKRKPPFCVIFKLKKKDLPTITLYESNTPVKDKMIGYVQFQIYPDRIDAVDVTIEPHFQKKGYGRFLMKILQAYAQELQLPIELSSLDNALPFYKKCGFTKKPRQSNNLELIWRPKRKRKKK